MRASPAFEFPPKQERALEKARKLEWLTIAYLLSVTVIMFLAMGSSQAMKTAWLEDVLSLVPPCVFLIASRMASREPDERFPYGYHRVVSIAFLCASLALFVMGAWLLIDAVISLVSAEHPTIGVVTLFGHTLWQGWLMIPALIWSAVPAVFIGRAKLPLSRTLHDKVLFTDAQMNKADWMTATAAMAGVLGIGLGWWWADSAAAALISISIVHDGFGNLRQVIFDLMDERPRTVDRSHDDPLPEKVREHLQRLPWVERVQVRMREAGHVYFGEAFVVVADARDLPDKLEHAKRECEELDFRLHDLVIVPVPALD